MAQVTITNETLEVTLGGTSMHAEDAAHVNADQGMMLLAVRKDTAAALADSDGDYVPLIVDANGRLHTILAALPSPPGTLRHGQITVTTAGTRVQVSASSVPLSSGVTITAHPTNTGTMYVGGSGVTAANGYPLGLGLAVFVEIDDLNKLWIDAGVNGEKIGYVGS